VRGWRFPASPAPAKGSGPTQASPGGGSTEARPCATAHAAIPAQEALDLLDRYNRAVEAGAPLASPGAEACRFCAYKAWCGDFWRAARPSWHWPLASIEGHAEAPVHLKAGGVALRVRAAAGTVSPGDYWLRWQETGRFEVEEAPAWVRITNARQQTRSSERPLPDLVPADRTELWYL
jgi:hypothetical protein